MLLKNKADVNKITLDGKTVVHFAAESGGLEILQHLIKNNETI
jgi:ankyrin repeat protein